MAFRFFQLKPDALGQVLCLSAIASCERDQGFLRSAQKSCQTALELIEFHREGVFDQGLFGRIQTKLDGINTQMTPSPGVLPN